MKPVATEYRDFVIRPVLEIMGGAFNSEAAVQLLALTGAAESGFEFRRQRADYRDGQWSFGPARGIYQMEDDTFDDVCRYLQSPVGVEERGPVQLFMPPDGRFTADWLCFDDALATAMARIKFWMDPVPLPAASDFDGLWRYYKRVWNTRHGAATRAHVAEAVRVCFSTTAPYSKVRSI